MHRKIVYYYYISKFHIVPPKAASLRVVSTTPDSITIHWESTDDGYSPISRALMYYKMTYGEWADTEVTTKLNFHLISL